jgi:hypothetical protein
MWEIGLYGLSMIFLLVLVFWITDFIDSYYWWKGVKHKMSIREKEWQDKVSDAIVSAMMKDEVVLKRLREIAEKSKESNQNQKENV